MADSVVVLSAVCIAGIKAPNVISNPYIHCIPAIPVVWRPSGIKQGRHH